MCRRERECEQGDRASLMRGGQRNRHDQQQGGDAEARARGAALRPAIASATAPARVAMPSRRWLNCTAATFSKRLSHHGVSSR
jgi:hypothetical protein